MGAGEREIENAPGLGARRLVRPRPLELPAQRVHFLEERLEAVDERVGMGFGIRSGHHGVSRSSHAFFPG